MNENNAIKSYELYRNDNGSYCVEIMTDAFSVTYENVDITFLTSGIIAFPVKMEAKNEAGDTIFNWDLTKSPNEQGQVKTQEEAPHTGEVTE